MNKSKRLVGLAPVAAALALILAAAPTWAGEVRVKGADQLEISGYTQARFELQNGDDSLVNSSFFIRRSRVKLAADINEHTFGHLEVDFASSRILKDAFVGVRPNEQFTVQLGQFKKPFSQEELFSSSATPVIDLGLTNALTTEELGFSGRDQGVMVTVQDRKGAFTAYAGAFSGAGEGGVSKGDQLGKVQTEGSNRGKDFAARLVVAPQIKTRLSIAINASAKTVGGSFTEGSVTHKSETFTAFGGDLMVMPSPELTIYAEALTGDRFDGYVDTLSSFNAPTFLGFHVAGSYHTGLKNGKVITAVQPEARFEVFDPDTDTDDDGATLLTAGLSLFFGKNVRWRNNVVIESFQDSSIDSETRFVSELQGKI
jgi:hypothetical protein